MVGLAFPISAILILLGLSSLHMDSQSFLMLSLLGGILIVHGFASDIANTDFAVLRGVLIPMFAIVVLMNLYTAGIIDTTPEFNGFLHSLFTCLFPGMQVALFMTLAVWTSFFCACSLGMDEVLLHLDLGWLPSVQISCFTTSGSSFTLTDIKFCLIITTSLLFLGGLVAAYRLTASDVANTERTEVSGWFAMWSILALTNLCAVGIVPEFGSSIHSINSYSVPGMQVMLLVMAFGIGSTAFCLVMTKVLGSLGLLPSSRITSLLTPGSIFVDCQSFLMLSLLGGSLPWDSVHPVQWENAELAKISEWLIAMWAILALRTLCAAGIIVTVSEFDGAYLHSLYSCSFPGMKVVLVIALGVGLIAFFRVLEVLHLDLGWLPSVQISCFTTSGSSFTLTDIKFCLIITTSLLFLGGLVAAYRLTASDVANTERTEVSGWFAMWSILVLTTVCAAGIAGTAPGFGDPPMMAIMVLMSLWVAGKNKAFPTFVGPNLISNLV